MLRAFISRWYSSSASGPPTRTFFAAQSSMCGRFPSCFISGTPYPQESAIRSTSTRTIARRASGVAGAGKPDISMSPSNRGSDATTTSPRPCSRTIRGGPSKAHSMITMRPFSRTCAIVSAPLPIRSR